MTDLYLYINFMLLCVVIHMVPISRAQDIIRRNIRACTTPSCTRSYEICVHRRMPLHQSAAAGSAARPRWLWNPLERKRSQRRTPDPSLRLQHRLRQMCRPTLKPILRTLLLKAQAHRESLPCPAEPGGAGQQRKKKQRKVCTTSIIISSSGRMTGRYPAGLAENHCPTNLLRQDAKAPHVFHMREHGLMP